MKEEILATVKKLEGLRDGCYHYEELEERADFIEETFASAGFKVERDEFDFSGRRYRNIIATASGMEIGGEWTLVGAHYDAVTGSPGADDNGSGVGVMIEVARNLGPREGLKFVAFTIEEPQPGAVNFLVGSRHFARKMKCMGQRYRGVFILESVGYISRRPNSQFLPPLVKAPKVGDFIGVVANKGSKVIMDLFRKSAAKYVPELKVVTYVAPLNGYLLPQTRFSDHAPFWDEGYPAVMLTDTAMFRNPNYHTEFDRSETLSADFMAQVAEALMHAVADLQVKG